MRTRGALAAFLAALIVAALGTIAVMALTAPGHQVVAQFRDADGLVAGNEIRIHGVVAGSVVSVGIRTSSNGDQYATATLRIDDAYWPLHQGAQVAIKPRGVLSNVYVQIDAVGSGGNALPGGYTFAVSQTNSPINLDALTDINTPDVRTATRTQIQQGAVALGGGGTQGLATTLDNVDPLLQAAQPTTAVLAQRTPELDRLNAEFDAVSAKLATEDAHLRSLVRNADTTVTALATQQANLQGTIVNADASLTEIDAALRGEQANLQAIFQEGPHALSLAQQNGDALTPLIAAINPHVANLDQLLYEFMTATGFNQGTPGGIDTLRVDGTLPPNNHGAVACGGEPSQQQSACPGVQPQGTP